MASMENHGKKKFIFIFITIILLSSALVSSNPLRNFIMSKMCAQNDGKWASNGNYCISRNCADNESCKPSYNNNAICKNLKIGIDRNELLFELGMPLSYDGDRYTFPGGGAEHDIIAILENEKVIQLECNNM